MAGHPPASQTAPIDEFRILWTSQKKQKLKKWQDGFLRFHTYNRKMIVYDETRTLVCDMYLQRADKVAAGDEFEFEHHLVTVEEFKGRVIQDLSAIFSPIAERRQQRQLQITHQQHPVYPERGMRFQSPAQDSPMTARQTMHSPTLPRQVGGVGEADHVNLVDILKRSAEQQGSGPIGIRTPARRESSSAMFRSGTTMAISGPNFRGKETPTRSATVIRPLPRAAQGVVTPVYPNQPPEKNVDIRPSMRYVQSTESSIPVTGHGIGSAQMQSAIHRDGAQVANDMTAGTIALKPQNHGPVVVGDSPRLAPSLPSRPSQTHRRTPFNPPSRSLPAKPQTQGRTRPQSPQTEDGESCQSTGELTESVTQKALRRPTFSTAGAVAVGVAGDDQDMSMGDAPSLPSKFDPQLPKGRKRASEDLPTTTIKLGTTKRKMLLCRSIIRRGGSGQAKPKTEEPTKISETEWSRRRRSADPDVMTKDADDDLSLGDKLFVDSQMLQLDEASLAVTASTLSNPMRRGFAANRPLKSGEVLSRNGHDGNTGQRNLELNHSVEALTHNKSSIVVQPYGSSSFEDRASRRNHSLVAVIDGEKKKRKEKTGGKTKEGSAHATNASKFASEGCLDDAEDLGNSERVIPDMSRFTTSMSSPPATRRRERKKKERDDEVKGAAIGGRAAVTNFKSRESGPWSMEAFDLFEWRPPNLVG